MAYIHNQQVLTFELGEDGEHLVSRDGARNPAVVSLIEMLEAHFKKVEQSS